MSLAEEHPTHVRPEPADARRVRILWLVGVLMVQAVRGNPEHRTTLERERAADREEVVEQLERLESTVRVEPVVSHADTQPDGHPVQRHGDEEIGPAEGKQRGDSLNVEPDQNDAGQDAQFAVARRGGRLGRDAVHTVPSVSYT